MTRQFLFALCAAIVVVLAAGCGDDSTSLTASDSEVSTSSRTPWHSSGCVHWVRCWCGPLDLPISQEMRDNRANWCWKISWIDPNCDPVSIINEIREETGIGEESPPMPPSVPPGNGGGH